LALIPKRLLAQTRAGFLPSINFNQKLTRAWDFAIKSESRHFFYEESTLSENFDYQYSLTDVSALVGKKVGLSSKVISGFLARSTPDGMIYRSIQQWILKSNVYRFKAAHRIAADQTFSTTELPEFRLRYRLSTQLPLSGSKLDVKEYYVKLNTEILNGLQGQFYDLEFRIIPHLGYVINERHKIELGWDNRFDSFANDQTRLTSWITFNWYFNH
jgi:hypothetical protein